MTPPESSPGIRSHPEKVESIRPDFHNLGAGGVEFRFTRDLLERAGPACGLEEARAEAFLGEDRGEESAIFPRTHPTAARASHFTAQVAPPGSRMNGMT